jgi:hypothetical protein
MTVDFKALLERAKAREAAEAQYEAVIVFGSRDYPNPQDVWDFVDTLEPETLVVHGGARGVDTWAGEAAKAFGLPTEVFPADWERHGKSAGFRRNERMFMRLATRHYKRKRAVAFWDGQSRGTKHGIELAESWASGGGTSRVGVELLIVRPRG